MVEGDDHREAYTAIVQGGLLSREIDNVAEAEAVDIAEGNMCGPLCEGLTLSRGRRPHHAQRERVGTWEISRLTGRLYARGPHREGDEPKPMMNGREKSDPAVVAVKSTNKAGRPGAESVEPRAGTKGNADRQSTLRAQGRAGVSQALGRIRQAARQSKKEKFTTLLHHVDVALLRESFSH